jgi:hypothetical protein
MNSHDTHDIYGTAPFIIESTSSFTGSLNDPDEARALLDLLHVTPTGENVYWNGSFNSSGLICGINVSSGNCL